MSGIELPLGWASCCLGEVAYIRTGKLDANAQSRDGKYPFFTCGDEILRINEYAFDTEAVLLAGNGNFNVKWYKGKFNAYQRTYVIEPLRLVGKYLYYLIQHQLQAITSGNRGSTVRFIRLGDIADSLISLAPKQEQSRIVERIEECLSNLDTAVAALKRVQANLKRYRAAVLKAACEGRLVPTEAELARKEARPYESGEQLLARILQERRAKWEADQLARMIASGKHPKDDLWKKRYKELESPETSNLFLLPEGWTWASADQLAAEEEHSLAIGPFGSYALTLSAVAISLLPRWETLQAMRVFTPSIGQTPSLRPTVSSSGSIRYWRRPPPATSLLRRLRAR